MTGKGVVMAALLWASVAIPAVADAPGTSLLPVARPDLAEALRPDAMVLVTRAPGVQISLRPLARPFASQVPQLAMARRPATSSTGQGATVARGSICNRRDIRGENLPRIRGTLRGCGVKSPVRVSSVAGVALSRPAIMECRTAQTLNNWVKNDVSPIIGRLGGGLASLQVIADYSCRTRNSQPGAKISEHGKGRAIDISGFNLKDGTTLSVQRDWNNGRRGRLLKRMHRQACGPFGTVLGPDANRFHRDHFHLDTANYGGGAYCR